jgi:hypothetical protein
VCDSATRWSGRPRAAAHTSPSWDSDPRLDEPLARTQRNESGATASGIGWPGVDRIGSVFNSVVPQKVRKHRSPPAGFEPATHGLEGSPQRSPPLCQPCKSLASLGFRRFQPPVDHPSWWRGCSEKVRTEPGGPRDEAQDPCALAASQASRARRLVSPAPGMISAPWLTGES